MISRVSYTRAHRSTIASALLLALLGCPYSPLFAQEGHRETGPFPVDVETAARPVAEAVPTMDSIFIDGLLDEASWARAPRIANFIQALPDEGYPGTQETVVRVLYDEKHLYFGAIMYDDRADLLVSGTLERDHPGVSAHHIDMFGVFLDTFLDRRNGYLFLVNPAGAVRDGQAFDNSRNLDFAWDGVVHVATRIHEEGWTVEMAIPWTTLRFDPTRNRQEWGVNFHRSVSRRNERQSWAPLDRRHQAHYAEKAGTVMGPESVPSGRNLRLKPFLVAQNGRGASLPDWRDGSQADGGFDLKWGLTSRLTMDLTWRADFSHVEVDQEQVNLSRFPLFFPERRDFFVENSGTFQFGEQSERNYRSGTSSADFRLFHSRRIGLEGGRPVPITGGGRLTGQVGETELGVLHIRTGESNGLEGAGIPGEEFSVVRLRRQLFGASDAGILFTDRRGRPGEPSNQAAGADLNLRLGPNFIVNSYLARTSLAEEADGSPWAGRIWLGWRDRLWDASLLYRQVGEDFDPGVGFVRRTDVRHLYATLGAHPRPPIRGVLDVNPHVEVHRYRNLRGELETAIESAGFGVEFQDGGALNLRGSRTFEHLYQGFRVEGQLTVDPGEYEFHEGSVRYQSSRQRALSAGASISGGGYFGGTRRSVGGNVRWMPGPRMVLDLQANRNNLSLGDVRTTANLYAVRARIAHSTHLYLSSFVQYNQARDQLVTNFRLTFHHAPLSEAYLVVTEHRDLGGAGVTPERLVALKVTKLFQF